MLEETKNVVELLESDEELTDRVVTVESTSYNTCRNLLFKKRLSFQEFTRYLIKLAAADDVRIRSIVEDLYNLKQRQRQIDIPELSNLSISKLKSGDIFDLIEKQQK